MEKQKKRQPRILFSFSLAAGHIYIMDSAQLSVVKVQLFSDESFIISS